MRYFLTRICFLLAVLLVLTLPAACLACEAWDEPCQEEILPSDTVWMDVVYGSTDPDELRVTRIMTRPPGVSLREGPSAAARKIAGIHADTMLDVIRHVPGWYLVRYQGEIGYVNDSSEFVMIIGCVTPQPLTPSPAPVVTPTPKPATPTPNRNPSVMETPALGDRVCQPGEMNMAVFWVQTQLMATGQWLQEAACSVTGVLDEETMAAVSDFMNMAGQPEHGGMIDQSVIDELSKYLGSRAVAVYTGGFYEAMDAVMDGGPEGSMTPIGRTDGAVSSGEPVRWAQKCLSFLGYYTGEIDGKYNEETRVAVRLFERNNGFAEQDWIHLGAARAIMEAYYCNRGDLGQLM